MARARTARFYGFSSSNFESGRNLCPGKIARWPALRCLLECVPLMMYATKASLGYCGLRDGSCARREGGQMNRITIIAAALVALAKPAMQPVATRYATIAPPSGIVLFALATAGRTTIVLPCYSRRREADDAWRRTPANKARISSRMPSMAMPARSTIDAPTGR